LQIELLLAKESDAEELVVLRIAAMRESLERIGRFNPQRVRERFLSGFSPKHTRHIVQDGTRVGFVVVKPIEEGLLLNHLYPAGTPRLGNWGLGPSADIY
jgi:hypothetical protein